MTPAEIDADGPVDDHAVTRCDVPRLPDKAEETFCRSRVAILCSTQAGFLRRVEFLGTLYRKIVDKVLRGGVR